MDPKVQYAKIVGQRIRQQRQALALRQADVARHLHVSEDVIGALERGKRNLLAYEVSILCKVLNMDKNIFWG